MWGPGSSSSDADTCEFSSYFANLTDGSSGLKLARTGTCAASHGFNELVLRGHGLKELDDGVFHGMSLLTKIDISGNEIQFLPSDLCNGLSSLQVFNHLAQTQHKDEPDSRSRADFGLTLTFSLVLIFLARSLGLWASSLARFAGVQPERQQRYDGWHRNL